MKRLLSILLFGALSIVIMSFVTKRERPLVNADQGKHYPYAGGAADTIVLNDTVSYSIFVTHFNEVKPELHVWWDKIGTGNPTVKLDVYQSMDGTNWSTLKKGKNQVAWTKTFSPTADGELIVSAKLDTAYFTGRYIKYQWSTGNTASTKAKLGFNFKTNIE